MIRSLLLAGLVGGASATLTNTTRQTLLADRLTNQSLLGSGETCSDLGKPCNQNNNNCTSITSGSKSCEEKTGNWNNHKWLCGSEATCCVQDGDSLDVLFIDGYATFCHGSDSLGEIGTNKYCCSGQCCSKKRRTHYVCGTDC